MFFLLGINTSDRLWAVHMFLIAVFRLPVAKVLWPPQLVCLFDAAILSVCPVCPSVCLFSLFCVSVSLYPFVCLSVCLSVRLAVRPSVRLSVHRFALSIYLSVCLSVCPSVRPSVCTSVCPSACPADWLAGCLARWMDGWMDGWMARWLDRRMGGWVSGTPLIPIFKHDNVMPRFCQHKGGNNIEVNGFLGISL